MVREAYRDPDTSRRAIGVPSLRKAVLILDLVGRRGRLAFSTIQKTLDLPKSTTHQLLKTLADIGVLQVQADGYFMLGPKVCELGALGLRQRTIDILSLRHLEQLAGTTGLPCEIATFEGQNAVVLASAIPDQKACTAGCDGSRLPLNHVATGKALMAFLEDADRRRLLFDLAWAKATTRSISSPEVMVQELDMVRERGWALDDREAFDDTSCIAAPVFDNRNRIVAAVATVSQGSPIPSERHQLLADMVRAAADAVSQEMRGS